MCHAEGSVDNSCDDNGKCSCNNNVVGDKCDQVCTKTFFIYLITDLYFYCSFTSVRMEQTIFQPVTSVLPNTGLLDGYLIYPIVKV